MADKRKTKTQLINELEELRKRIASQEASKVELRQSEERYRVLVETIPHGVQEIDISGTITFANSAHCKIHGYEEGELIGKSALDLVASESEREELSKYLATLVKEQPKPMPYVGQDRTKDGRIKDIQVDWDYEKDNHGHVIGFVSILTDITERKRVEDELHKAHDEMEQQVKERTSELMEANEQLRQEIENRKRVEERLRESETYISGILNAAPAGIGLVRNRELNWISHRMCEMLGYSADELVGQSARIAYESDEEFERVGRVKYSEIQERGVGSVETRFKCKDGSVLDVLLCSSAVDPNDLSKGAIFTAMDISERKLAEQALRESEERFRHLSAAAFEAIVIHDKGVILQANDQFYKMFGYEPEELEGIDAIPLIVTAKSAAFMKEQIELGNLGPYEVVGLRKDGTTFPMEIRIKFMEYKGNKVRMAALRDLTEQRQAEEALRESEEKYRSLVESSIDGIAIVQGTEFKFANEALLDMLSISKEKEILGQNFTNFISHEYQDMMVQRGLDRESGKDVPSRYEFKALRQDGTEFDVEISVNPISYEGKPARQAILRDITKRKQAENEIRESEERFRAVLEAVPDLMLILDPEGGYREVFTANSDLLYVPVDQLLGKKIHDILPPEDAQHIQEIIDRVLATGELQISEYQLETGGIERWFAGRSIKFRFQDADCVLWCARDITQRKMAEEALRESEERHRKLLEASPDPIVVYDMEGRATYVNPAFVETFGWSSQELLGKNIEFVPEENWPETRGAIARMLRGEKIQSFETRRLTKDGMILDIQLSSSVFHDRDDNTVGNIVILRDVSKRKRAEDALRNREAELAAQSRHLEEVNAALRVLLKQRENDKADLEERLLANVKELVLPYVEKLKNSRLHSDQMTLVDILESNMKEIVSPFVAKLSSRFLSLTPTEIQVASLIKDGKTSKEIATLLNASENTVRTHRFHIRSKLGIKNKKVNFRSYLQSLQD